MLILHSKLLIPRIGDTIIRQGDASLRKELSSKRICLITAGAGYGKTTFVAQAVDPSSTVWYRLSESDTDFSSFLSYLAAGIDTLLPGFNEETRAFLHDEGVGKKDMTIVLASFIHALEKRYDSELTIVLDDFHTVQGSREILDCLRFLLEHLPASARVIIMSRTQVDIPISRLRVAGDLFEVGEADLVFNPQEISGLFEKIYGMKLDREAVAQIHARSQGWIAGIILFYHALKGKDREGICETLEKVQASGRLVSEYLEENVFTLLPEEMKGFLLKTSLLSRLNTTICNRFLEIGNSHSLLEYLKDNHFFTFSLDETGQEYAYHHLFRDFLRSKLTREYGEKELRILRRKAAAVYEEHAMREDAVAEYLAAEEFGEAIRVLDDDIPRMIPEGRLNLLKGFLESFPREIFSANPILIYLRAHVDSVSGRLQEAIEGFQRAQAMFEEQGLRSRVDMCEHCLGVIYYPMGYFRKVEEQLTKALNNPSCDPTISMLFRAHLIFVTSYLRKIDTADRYFQEAMADVEQIADKPFRDQMRALLLINHTVRYITSGDFRAAAARAEEAKPLALRGSNSQLQMLYYNNHGLACFYAGRFAEGLEDAGKGLNLVREKGYRDILTGWLLLTYSMNCTGLNRMTEAIEYGSQASACFREMGSLWGEASACTVFQMIHLRTGNILAAEEAIDQGLKILEGIDFPEIQGQLMMGRAMIRVLQGQFAEAESLVEGAIRANADSKFFAFWKTCFLAGLSFLKGEREEAIDHAREALKTSREHGYGVWMASHMHFLSVPMASLYEKGEMREYLREIFSLIDPEVKEIFHQLEANGDQEFSKASAIILGALPALPPPGLNITMLGNFRLCRGEEEVPRQSWPSKKARMLFKLLVHYRPRGFVSKEVFMEHLWHEEDPEKSAKRFHVALGTVRKVLEPSKQRAASSSYILSDGDTYMLHLGDGGAADVEEFEKHCSAAQEAGSSVEAIESLMRADDLFRGEYLEEDLYESWCIEERDRLHEKHLSVLASIIDYHEQQHDFRKAVAYCTRYLAQDPYAEDLYQRLMCLHARMGNASMVRKTYEKCCKSIRDGLDCPVSLETERLFEILIAANPPSSK